MAGVLAAERRDLMLRRYAPVLAGVAGAGIILPFVVGPGVLTMLTLPIFGALGVLALVGSRRTAAPEPGWQGPTSAVALDPAAAPHGPGPRQQPPDWRVAAAISRMEARDLSTSPWLGVGLGFLVVSFLVFNILYGPENGEQWAEVARLAPWLAHPFVGMVVLAAHRSVTRARRDGCDELFDTCPAGPIVRTWGFLGSAWVAIAVLAGFFTVYGIGAAVRSPNLYGDPGLDAIAVLLSGLALGAGGVALGVALGRWVHFSLAPVAAVVAVGFFSLRLATIGDPGWNPLQHLSTFPPVSGQTPAFADGPEWSHLGWVVALTGVVVVIALARHRRDRTVAVMALAAGLLLAVTGVAATRPMPGSSARRIAARVARPADHQTCRPSGPVQVCVFRGNEELGSRATVELAPVAAMLPVTSAITLRQRFDGDVDDLPPEVARLLPDGVPPVPAGEVRLGFGASPGDLTGTRSLLALAAVGLPPAAGPDAAPLVVAGQARGVVALWLSTRGLGPAATRSFTTSRSPGEHCWSDASVAWSPQDLRAARALIALPEAGVRAAVQQGWDRWRDPSVGTDELLAAVALPPGGPYDPVSDGSRNPC